MKKISLLIVFSMLITIVNAQFSTGESYLRGSFSANYNKEEVNETNGTEAWGVNIAPSIMKFKTEKRATGFRLLASHQYSKSYNPISTSKSNITALGAGVFMFNVLPLGKGFFLSAETGLDATYGWGKQTNSALPNNKFDINDFNVAASVTPSLGYKLTKRLIVGVDFANIIRVGYQNRKVEQTVGSTTTTTKNNNISLSSSFNNTNVGQLGISFGLKL